MNIEIRGLSKSYRKVRALTGINLTLGSGIHGLLGPNGAGKTTLIRILATILDADQGEIVWGDALNWKNPRSIKGKVGYLPQSFSMYKYLRVEEALRHIALLKDIPMTHEKEQVELALDRTNLSGHAKQKIGELSGGMLRRLGIAQAILGEPTFLILDEPSVGLDPTERINLRKLIRDYDNGERIVLISSHIVNDVESLCDTVSIMHCGEVLISGSAVEINAKASRYVKEEMMSVEMFRETEKAYAVIDFVPVDCGYKVRYLTNEETDDSVADIGLEDSYTYIIQRNRQL